MKTRKLFTTSLIAAVIFAVMVFSFGTIWGVKSTKAYAETNTQAEVISSEIEPFEETETETEPTTPTEEEEHTIWTRLGEWFSTNLVEFLSSVDLIAMVGCIISVVLERKANKKFTAETKAAITANTTTTNANTASNDKVLEAMNTLIDLFNEIKENDVKRDEVIAKLSSENKAVLEILATVYANNKNIPQAIKDLVTLKYVNALKEENAMIETTAAEPSEKETTGV